MTTDTIENTTITPEQQSFDDLIAPLLQTKPWVSLCAILGFISCAFMVLGGLAMMFGLGAAMMGGASGAGFGIGMGLLYLVFALIALIPPFYLYKYSKAIGVANKTRSMAELTQALTYQKSFWKFIGILMVIYLVFFVLGIVLSIGTAIFATM
ncbi:MAG: hypothetical protein ACI9O6_000081 [Glaciecola sp.]|jgi:hypothetical protein